MASATYQFIVDTSRNSLFDNPIDDLSSYVLSYSWTNGMANPYDEVAPCTRLTVQVRDQNGEFTSEAVGSEALVNGGFSSWTAGNPDSWTVTGESGTDPEVSQVGSSETHGGSGTGACNLYATSSASTLSIESTAVLTIGQSYRCVINVSTISAGGVAVYCGGVMVSVPIQTAGEYTFYFNAFGTKAKIQNWYATNTTIDSISIKPVALYTHTLKRGTLCGLIATFNATPYAKWGGRLVSKQATIGAYGARVCTLTFEDPFNDLLNADYNPDLQQNVTIPEAIQPVFDVAKTANPYSHSYWMLGMQGSSELDESTILVSPLLLGGDTTTGDTTLDFVGDNSDINRNGIDPQSFIRNMMAAECGGRFFWSEDGAFVFHRRNHDILNSTIAYTFTENDIEADMCTVNEGNDLVNSSSLMFQPRKVGASGSVIWQSSSVPVTVTRDGDYKTTARYQDTTNGNARVGATTVITPAAGLDIVANFPENGRDASTYLDVYISKGANSSDLVLHNRLRRNHPIQVTTLQLRGTPITFYDSKTVTAINPQSIHDYVLAEESLNIPAISDEDFAQSAVDYRVAKFGMPFRHFESIGWIANGSSTRMEKALALSVGDKITVTEAFSSHDADYVVVGARHQVTIGGEHTHMVTLVLKPASREDFWLLNDAALSLLGQTTRLAF